MLNISKNKATFYGFLSCALFASILFFYGSVQAEVAGLKLTLDLGKPRVVFGEPVYIAAKLENTSPEAIAVFPTLFPEDSALHIEVIEPDGRRRIFVPYALDLNDLAPKNLAQGDSISAAFPIFYGGRKWTFQQEGKYQIRGIFENPASGKPMAKSDPVELIVTQDDGSGKFLLQGGKASDQAGEFLLWQSGDHLRAGIAHLESLIEQYPDSVLADYAQLAFAHNLSRPFRDYSIGKLRKPNPKAALKYLEKVKFDHLPPYLQVKQIVTESRSQALLGNTDKAKSVLNRAHRIVQKQPALKPLLD